MLLVLHSHFNYDVDRSSVSRKSKLKHVIGQMQQRKADFPIRQLHLNEL